MKMKSMSKYFINILGCLGLLMGLSAQETKSNGIDSLIVQKKYGLRVGVDLSKITRSFLDTDYMGFEINGDYRLSKNLYIAAEIGSEKKNKHYQLFKQHWKWQLYKSWSRLQHVHKLGWNG